MAVESHGLPVSVVPDGADRHDVKLPEDTLRPIVIAHPEGAHLCLGAVYTGSQKTAEDPGYKAHIRGWGKRVRRRSAARIMRRGGGRWNPAIRD
jgi:hypothetical protein